jgi:hypothetical protein
MKHLIHPIQTIVIILALPSLTPTPPALPWTWVLTLNVLRSFHLGLCCLHLYNRIPTILQRDVQVAFRFSLDKLM